MVDRRMFRGDGHNMIFFDVQMYEEGIKIRF